jgi:hypothetical protein
MVMKRPNHVSEGGLIASSWFCIDDHVGLFSSWNILVSVRIDIGEVMRLAVNDLQYTYVRKGGRSRHHYRC